MEYNQLVEHRKRRAEIITNAGNINEAINSVGTTGAFGHFYRSMFDLRPKANSLNVTPASLGRIKNLKVKDSVRWSGKELYLELCGNGKLTKATLDGKEIEIVDSQTVEIPFKNLNEKSSLKMELK